MTGKDRGTRISKTSGQVAVGNRNTQTQVTLGTSGNGDKSVRDLPWKIIGAVTATVGAIAAVIALFVS
jgi:ElaB/YqjD/DUF883 family membrane-anchored ribosome-binding protein